MKKNKLFKHLEFDSKNGRNGSNIIKSNSANKMKTKNLNSMSQSIGNNNLLLSFNSSNNNKQIGKSLHLDSGSYPNMSIISNIPNLNNSKLNNSLKNTMIIQEYLNKVFFIFIKGSRWNS